MEGKGLRIEPGQALLVLPNQFHHYISLEQDALRWLFVTFELRQGEGRLQHLSHQPLRPDLLSQELWAKLLATWLPRNRIHQGELLPIVDQLLIRLSRPAAEAPSEKTGSLSIAAPSDWIARVESLIIRSIREGDNLESVARAVGISSRHLRSRFEAATGVCLRDYRSSYQLSRSIALMQNTHLRLGEIAELCGFNSQPVFTRFIRRHMGKSPIDIRAAFKVGAHANTHEDGHAKTSEI